MRMGNVSWQAQLNQREKQLIYQGVCRQNDRVN